MMDERQSLVSLILNHNYSRHASAVLRLPRLRTIECSDAPTDGLLAKHKRSSLTCARHSRGKKEEARIVEMKIVYTNPACRDERAQEGARSKFESKKCIKDA